MAKVIRKAGPGKAALEKIIKGLKDQHVRVGFLETSTYEGGTPMAYVAAIHEYGCAEKNIPPRPIFAPTVDRCEEKWRKEGRQLAKWVLEGKRTSAEALKMLGDVAAGDVKRTITMIKEPPLKEATVLKRLKGGGDVGSADKPLVDTGDLLREVTCGEVADGKGGDT